MNISSIPSSINFQHSLHSLIPSIKLLLNPFGSKFSLSWKDNLVIAGIVVAVGSAAAAVFLNLFAAAVSFTALAILLGFTLFYVHNFNDGIALDKTVQTLKLENQQLQTTQKKMQAAADQLQKQYRDIQGINAQLNQTITTIRVNIQRLENANASLTQGNQRLLTNLNQLKQSNKDLSQRVDQLQKAIPILKNQVATFTEQNVALGKELNVLDIEKVGVDQETKLLASKVKDFDMTFDQDVKDLSEQIHRAAAVSSSLFTRLNDQRKELDVQVNSFTSSVGNLQELETALKQRSEELHSLGQRAAKRTEELEAIEKQMQQAQTNLDATKNAFDAEATKLKAIQDNITQQEKKLEATTNQLQAFSQKLEEAEKQMQQKMGSLELVQQNTLTVLKNKINEKTEEAKQKNRELGELDIQINQKTKLLQAMNAQLEQKK
jgi:chromosome segregation ATPase